MSSFTDLAGVTRSLSINLAHRRTIKQQTGWDLVPMAFRPDDLDKFLNALQQDDDDDLLWRIIAILTGTDAADLMANADGTVWREAADALIEAVVAFFPAQSPLRRPLGEVLRQQKTSRAEILVQVENRILEAVNDIHSGISGLLESTSGSGEFQHSPQVTG